MLKSLLPLLAVVMLTLILPPIGAALGGKSLDQLLQLPLATRARDLLPPSEALTTAPSFLSAPPSRRHSGLHGHVATFVRRLRPEPPPRCRVTLGSASSPSSLPSPLSTEMLASFPTILSRTSNARPLAAQTTPCEGWLLLGLGTIALRGGPQLNGSDPVAWCV
jgi:hypothetical protein